MTTEATPLLSRQYVLHTLDAFEKEGGPSAQEGYARKKKAQARREKLLMAVVFGVLGAGALVYGVADVFGGYKLPMGVAFLIGGPCLLVGALLSFWTAVSHDAYDDKASPQQSPKDVCEFFYSSAFGKPEKGVIWKKDHLVNVCSVIPFTVMQHYDEGIATGTYGHDGWKLTEPAKPGKKDEPKPVQCVLCQNRAEHTRPVPHDKYVKGDFFSDKEKFLSIYDVYATCAHCGSTLCRNCYRSKQFLCPICGKATNGWDGLADRWSKKRRVLSTFIPQDAPLSPKAVEVSEGDIGETTQNVIVRFEYGVAFKNVCAQIGGRWFLLSPEPLSAQGLECQAPNQAPEATR